MFKNKLSKDMILQQTNKGLDIFSSYLKQEITVIEDAKFYGPFNFPSDVIKNSSINIYFDTEDNEWMCSDCSDNKQYDAFEFASNFIPHLPPLPGQDKVIWQDVYDDISHKLRLRYLEPFEMEVKTNEVEIELTPSFNKELFLELLPDSIIDVLKESYSVRQRDVALLSYITLISGSLPKVYVIHDKRKMGLNLNSFIIAPAASGKSSMSDIQRTFEVIEKQLEENYKTDLEEYKSESKKKDDIEVEGTTPIKPIKKSLFLPANSSSSAIIKSLNENDGRGIICETEADTLSGILTKDWANYDDMLRKAFHHETISMRRLNNENSYSVRLPYLSLLLTGTPDQVKKLIPSTENGLFSRFCFYYFETNPYWKSEVFSANGWEDNIKLSEDSEKFLLNIYNSRLIGDEIIIQWSPKQALELDNYFTTKLNQYTKLYGNESSSVIYRLGLIASRFMGVLMFLNYFEEENDDNNQQKILICKDELFPLIKNIMDVLIEHSFYIYEQLPSNIKKTEKDDFKGSKLEFLNILPDSFSRYEAINRFAKKIGIKERTADGYLSEYVNRKLLKNLSGKYSKIA